jgi:hypothetical protein
MLQHVVKGAAELALAETSRSKFLLCLPGLAALLPSCDDGTEAEVRRVASEIKPGDSVSKVRATIASSISGTVLDNASHPLPNVNVSVHSSTGTVSTKTDRRGRFTLLSGYGNVTVLVEAEILGHSDCLSSLSIESGDSLRMNYTLGPGKQTYMGRGGISSYIPNRIRPV